MVNLGMDAVRAEATRRPAAWTAMLRRGNVLLGMFTLFTVLFCCSFPVARVAAQEVRSGSIFGKVTEVDSGRELTNATARVVGSGLTARSGSDGDYVFPGIPPGIYSLEFSLSGYEKKLVEGVPVVAGEATRTNVTLNLELYELPLLEVMGDPLSGLDAQLRFERINSPNIIESITTDMMDKQGLGDAGEIITKAVGISVVDGKTAVVRGLSDRYNLTLLNGGEVPTADPYRKSAQLDMFTSDVLAAVVISKTFTPDLPGGFSGALIDLRTKSFPPEFMFKASFGVGYNTQSTGNENYLTYPGGDLDFLAFDDGSRALPSELNDVTGTELERLRQTATSGSNAIPLEEKTAAAEELDQLTRSFESPHMGPTTGAPPPDHDFGFVIGDSFLLADRLFGYFAGFSYERDYRHYDDGFRGRYSPVFVLEPPSPWSEFDDVRSKTTAEWSAFANVAYRIAEGHELSANFLYSQVAEDQARQLVGRITTSGINQFPPNTNSLTYLNTLSFVERNLTSFQLHGDHEITALGGLRVAWLAALADTYQDEPDLRYFNLIANDSGSVPVLEIGQNYIPYPDAPTRYFRRLEDRVEGAKIDLTMPVEDARGLEWKAGAGLAVSRSERTMNERTFSYVGGNNTAADPVTFPYEYMSPLYAPPPRLVEFAPGRFRYSLSRYLNSAFGNSFYEGQQDIDAAYVMAEVPLLEALRLIGGVRYETTFLKVTSSAFQSNETFSGLIDQQDLLPAVSLAWSFGPEMKLRASYSQTVARPTYREFARFRSFDSVGDQIVEGNPNLRMSEIENFDLRWEWFTPHGGLLSVGGFFKLVDAPIEKVNGSIAPDGSIVYTGTSDLITFENGGLAEVVGVEFETRQNLAVISESLKYFNAGFNFAWINSEIPNAEGVREEKLRITGRDEAVRPLFDQSPYIVNADITYDNTASGTTVAVVYYFAAERLALITNNYDVYEQGAPSLDVIFSQRLGEHWKVKLSAENLLNPEIVQSYAVEGPTDREYVYSSFTRGITFGLSISCEF